MNISCYFVPNTDWLDANYLKSICQVIFNISHGDQFVLLMNSKCVKIITAVMNVLSNAYRARTFMTIQ